MRGGGGGQKKYVFVHAQGIKTVHAGVVVKKWQNSVHVVVECPLIHKLVVRAPAQVSDHFRSYRSLLHSEQLILKVAIPQRNWRKCNFDGQVGISEQTSM